MAFVNTKIFIFFLVLCKKIALAGSYHIADCILTTIVDVFVL